jgi:hypothetical protein
MKKQLLTLLLCLPLLGMAQINFTLDANSSIPGVGYGSIAFSDVDNDGDEDVLITGHTNNWVLIASLYLNDGAGNFSLVTGTPFAGVNNSFVAFSDIDNDGDEDVLITGSEDISSIAELYVNDGLGNFSLVTGTPFPGLDDASFEFSDIDNDGDMDLLMVGSSDNGPIAELYKNDGLGNFSIVTGTPFSAADNGSIAFSDVDNDGDEDVLITGDNWNTDVLSELYINDGLGNFSLVTNTVFTHINRSSISFSDIDNDGDEDVLMTGRKLNGMPSSELYKNDGLGNFSLVTGTPFTEVNLGSIAFADVDSDGDQDVFITGEDEFNDMISELYINNGLGSFSIATGVSFTGVHIGSIAFSDVDNDGDEDLLITGEENFWNVLSNLYKNSSIASSITEENSIKFELQKVINYLGQETKPTKNTPLFFIYDDGTVEKRIVIE